MINHVLQFKKDSDSDYQALKLGSSSNEMPKYVKNHHKQNSLDYNKIAYIIIDGKKCIYLIMMMRC